jgi:cell division control protein 6
MAEFIEEALTHSRQSVFTDESTLSFDYVPPKLLHREEQLKRLAETFHTVIEKPGALSPRAFIFGEVGVGKTALVKYFGEGMIRVAKNKEIKLLYVHINCRTVESKWALVLNIAMAVDPKELNIRGYGPNQMLHEIYDYLEYNNMYLLLALDEIDFFIKRTGENILYDFVRLNEELINVPKRLALIFISRDRTIYDLPQVDKSTLSSLFSANTIQLQQYLPTELTDILTQRVKLAFKPNTVLEEVIDFIADEAGKQGDARYAIELLALAGRYADIDQSKWVTPDHVRKAKSSIHPRIRKDDQYPLSKKEKAILLAVARSLEPEEAYVSFEEVQENFHVCCEELNLDKAGPIQLQGILCELAKTGLISIKQSNKKLFVSFPEIPIELFRHELEELLRHERKNQSANKKRPLR